MYWKVGDKGIKVFAVTRTRIAIDNRRAGWRIATFCFIGR
jgi:hypothetical protein